MPKIAVNNTTLYYELHGPPDADVVVLSNGILMGTASWGLQTPVLARHHQVLLYDCRGMWKSDHPQGPYTMELHADDLAALLDALAIEKAHIAGISYGAEVSMAFAIKYPQKTKSLFLCSTVSESEPVLRGFTNTWSTAIKAGDPQRLFQESFMLNFSDAYISANQAALEQAATRYAALDFKGMQELIDCFARLDLTDQLHQIKTPTMIVVGEEDILKPRKYSEHIASEIHDAKLVVVPGTGHALCLENPIVFNTLLLGFLALHKDK
jgi:3-oxoadipate enol-lactonase